MANVSIDEVVADLYGTLGFNATEDYELTRKDWQLIYEQIEECPNCGYFVYELEDDESCEFCVED